MVQDAHDYDIIVKGGTIVTMDDQGTVVEGGTLGITGQNISFIGNDDSGQDMRAKKVIEASGCAVLPGFVNIHTHTMLCMLKGQAEDMGFAPAYTLGVPQGHHLSPEDAFALAQLGALEALLFGSTLIWDSYVHAEAAIEAISALGMRVVTSSRIHDVDLAGVPEGKWTYKPQLGEDLLSETVALARRYNGKTNDMVAAQLMLHAPDTCSAALLDTVASTAAREGLLLHTHLAQSKKEVEFISDRYGRTPVEFLAELGILSDNLTAAHCIFVSESDIARMKASKMNVAHIPKGNLTGGTVAPTHQLRLSSINMALGTDNMHADMVETMRWALNVGRLQEGCISDDWQPHHVLRMATRAGARALKMEDKLGSIEVGKLADLVVVRLDRPHLTPSINVLGTLVHNAHGRDVDTVVVGGKVVVSDGHSTLCDEHQIMNAGKKVSKRLWENVV